MNSAVCSISSTASRSPPSVILGMPAVAALPIGFARRSSILSVPLAVDGSGLELVDHDADQLALGDAEAGDDAFHALVDVECDRKDRDQAVGCLEQPAVGGSPGHRGSVEDDK